MSGAGAVRAGLLAAFTVGALAEPGAPLPAESGAPAVEVLVLTKFHPHAATLDGPRGMSVAADGDLLRVDGRAQPAPVTLARAPWTITLDTGMVRRYEAALRIEAAGDELRIVAALDLENYVARAVAAETLPGTPPAALEAQAIVARSYALAPGARHREAPLCDLAHCQSLAPAAGPDHAAAARRAARATRGQVLRLAPGAIARAVFHSDCGGDTAEPQAVFGGDEQTGARAAADPQCSADAWTAVLRIAEVESAAGAVLGAEGPVAVDRLALEHAPDGRVLRLVDTATGRWAAGDAFARALDRARDWSVVKSARFGWTVSGGAVRIEGRGHGHGVGLCQRGAAAMARRGASAYEILRHYFEAATSLATRTPARAGSAAPPRSAPSPTG